MPPAFPDKTEIEPQLCREGSEFEVADKDEELLLIEEGCRVKPVLIEPIPAAPRGDWKDLPKDPPPPPEYPKTMIHPGYPNGAATGLLMKDFRGKNAEQVIWRFDSGLESRLADNLKQAAIEEGQWTEKRDFAGGVGIAAIKAQLNAGRQRAADAKIARDAAREAAAAKPKA